MKFLNGKFKKISVEWIDYLFGIKKVIKGISMIFVIKFCILGDWFGIYRWLLEK